MSGDYFDRLELELRAAVPRAVQVGPWPGRRRRWPAAGGIAIALSSAAVVAVAALAVVLLGHGGPAPARGPAATQPAMGAAGVPLRRLLATYGVLRRPQTDADRAWRPPHGQHLPVTVASLTRLARRLRNDDRVFMTVAREADGGYEIVPWVISSDGQVGGEGTGLFRQLQPDPFPDPIPGQLGTQWVGPVPDGVTRVRWTFRCLRPGLPCPERALSLPVLANVATVKAPDSWCSHGACPTEAATVWYGRHGHVIARWSATSRATNPTAPLAATQRPLRILHADGLGPARFGTTPDAVIGAVQQDLGRPSRPYSRTSNCVIDHSIEWASPAVDAPLWAFFQRGRFAGCQCGDGDRVRPGAVLSTLAG